MSAYKGKHIAVLGLSVEGSDAVRFLHKEGAIIACCDRRTKKDLGDAYKEFEDMGVSFRLGAGYLTDLSDFDAVVRTPGMLLDLPELVLYRKTGRTITSLTKIFFDECRAPIIGVTGSKGKGTTSTLIFEMLHKDGKKAYLGGNVGTPLLSRVREIEPDAWVVLELSSFQLQDLTKSPHIAVILRTTQDHLFNFDKNATNFHPTRDAYVQAKKPIVRYQTSLDVAIVNADDPTSSSFTKETRAKTYAFSSVNQSADAFVRQHAVFLNWKEKVKRLCGKDDIKIFGDHNLENIAAASIAAREAGVLFQAIRLAAREFTGLEHRLEIVRNVGGVTYVNDTFSTVPETTIAAMRSFDKPMILILGGSEKGSDFSQMGREIATSRVKVVVVIGDMTDRIIAALDDAGYRGKRIVGLRTMHEVVDSAARESNPGDIVILSPACASFDMFINYKERGYQFKHEVNHLAIS